jgi:uncharacterized protein (TIGR02588 family)
MSDEKENEEPPKITTLEWIVAIASALCIAGIVAILIYEQTRERINYPVISVKLLDIQKIEDGYLARVTVRNDGDKTGSRVECKADLVTGGNKTETSVARIEFVPPRSSKKAGFVFREDPRTGELRLRAGGFEER